jgi:hypothetical protein
MIPSVMYLINESLPIRQKTVGGEQKRLVPLGLPAPGSYVASPGVRPSGLSMPHPFPTVGSCSPSALSFFEAHPA